MNVNKKGMVLILFMISVLFFACSNGEDLRESWVTVDSPSVLETGLTMTPLDIVNDYSAILTPLVNASDHLEMELLARVEYWGFSGPIYGVTFTPPEPITHRVFLSGGIHGNEYVTSAAILELIHDLSQDPHLYPGTYFEIIPVINPWGIANGKRYNNRGQDLNRDFVDFSQLESQTVRDYIEGKHYDLVLNHHGMWGNEFMIFRFWGAQKGTGENVNNSISTAGYFIDRVDVGDNNGIVEIPPTDSVPSMDRYMRWHHSENVYVPETYSWDYRQITLDRGIVIQRIAQDVFIRRLY